MKGDSIIIEAHHEAAAADIVSVVLPALEHLASRFTISVAGQSGSGKSETATAIARALEPLGIESVIFHQDDYFIHPPKTNDTVRRADINWVGTGEVHLDLMDAHLDAFLRGASTINKPLADYGKDTILAETMDTGNALVALADGTYTTLLQNLNCRVFINRDYLDTRAHRTVVCVEGAHGDRESPGEPQCLRPLRRQRPCRAVGRVRLLEETVTQLGKSWVEARQEVLRREATPDVGVHRLVPGSAHAADDPVRALDPGQDRRDEVGELHPARRGKEDIRGHLQAVPDL